ncbi:MAG: hypothetical protein ACRCR5_09620 [Lactococcus garvieae]
MILGNIPNITLLWDNTPFVFVIPPTDIEINKSVEHNIYRVLDVGEVVGKNTMNCMRMSWSGFFPAFTSRFYNILNPRPAMVCVYTIREVMEQGKEVRVLIPNFGQNIKCKIESFDTKISEQTGDIHYSISLIENRIPKTAKKNLFGGLFKR